MLGDLDGDGRNDLVSRSSGGALVWRRNLDGGAYAAAQSIWQPSGPTSFQQLHSLLALDVDADGDLDVEWSVQYIDHFFPDGYAVWVAPNLGGGTFGPRQILPICADYPQIVLLPADPDGDGDRDLVAFASSGLDVQIPAGGEVRGTDLPVPTAPPIPSCAFVDPDEAWETWFAAEYDLDGDGDLDLVRFGPDGVRWFDNLGTTGFAPGSTLTSDWYSYGARFVDLDADGDADFLAAKTAGSVGTLVRRMNAGGAAFGGEQLVASGAPITRTTTPTDFDGDGDLDLVAGDHGSPGTWYFERSGPLSFLPPVDLGALHVQQLLTDDADGDGDVDLLVRGQVPTDGLYWIENLLVTPGALFCTGDAAGCPCSNTTLFGDDEGCRNSTGRGARLRTSGSAIVAHDNLELRVEQARANQPFMLLQGRNSIALPFKDGVLCAGSPSLRILRGTLDAAGRAETGGVSVVTEGAIPGPGQLRYYQAWFRDPQVSVCGTGSNFTNAVAIAWE
ncbi:MAG: VCBS repeat-containing protein [Planctomycetes bacterium]|nr:VCBS repeat-containing protein [Planctomycetota bacterium]